MSDLDSKPLEIPPEWCERLAHPDECEPPYADGIMYCGTSGDLVRLFIADGSFEYWIIDEEDMILLERVNPTLLDAIYPLNRKEAVSPKNIGKLLKLVGEIQAPAADIAFRDGRERGREDMRQVLRGLIGAEAVKAVT